MQVVLLILIVLLVPTAVIGNWLRLVVADESTFVTALQDLPTDHDVQDAVSQSVAQAVSQSAGRQWETFVDATVSNPATRRQLLSLNVDVYGFVESQTRGLMQQPDFQSKWIDISRAVHPLVKSVLLGSSSGTAFGTDGAIVLNLKPVYDSLVAFLASQGIDLGKVLPGGIPDVWLTVYESDQLQAVQRVARLIDRWAIPLAILAGLAMVGVVITARNKLNAGALVGLCVLASMTIAVLLLILVVRRVVNAGLDPVQRRGAIAIIGQLTSTLQTWMLVVGSIGAAVMVVCLIAQYLVRRSPSEPAWR